MRMKVTYLDEIILKPVRGSKTKWRLIKPLRCSVRNEVDTEDIKVPIGFKTDLASVPRPFWAFFPPHEKYTKAAIVHDYCYNQKCCSRKRADRIFRVGMKALRVSFIKRNIIYYAVRIFGRPAWRS